MRTRPTASSSLPASMRRGHLFGALTTYCPASGNLCVIGIPVRGPHQGPRAEYGLAREADRDDRGRVGHLFEDAEVDVRDRVAGLVVAGVERPARLAAEAAGQLG